MAWRPTEARRRAMREQLVIAMKIPGWAEHPRVVEAVDELLEEISRQVVAREDIEALEKLYRADGSRTWVENFADDLKEILDRP